MEEVENAVEDFPEEEEEDVPGRVKTRKPLSIFKIIRNFTLFKEISRNFVFAKIFLNFRGNHQTLSLFVNIFAKITIFLQKASACYLLSSCTYFRKNFENKYFRENNFCRENVPKSHVSKYFHKKIVTFSHVAGLF